jgi:hypothetical protein
MTSFSLSKRIDKLKFVQHQIAADETLRAGAETDRQAANAFGVVKRRRTK